MSYTPASQRSQSRKFLPAIALILALTLLTLSACAAPQPVQPTVSELDQPAATETPLPESGEAEESQAPEAATAIITPTAESAAAPDSAPALEFIVSGQHRGIPVGFTSDGNPFRGSPDAPITMFEYSDFQCPFCVRYFVQTEPAVNESYVRDGKLKVVFMDFPLVQLHPNAPAAHAASLCVADQGAELYWAMHDQIFRSQSEWGNSLSPAEIFERLVGEIGADVEVFKECVASAVKDSIVQQRVAAAAAMGFSGTPSFRFVNNASGESYNLIGAQPYDQFASTIDAMVAGRTPASAQQQQQQGSAEIPFWATEAGLALDPNRPGYTVAGDQTRGNPDALLTVVEFSDFQCPYCKRHTLESQPTLDEKYVASGKIRWVFKHFPLNIHPQAPAAGVAAECAAEQDKFWEMHELLFEQSSSWSISDPNPVFVGLAEELGLDTAAFLSCLADPEMQARVDSDLQEGSPYVRGTPTFIVLAGEGGQIIPGALPLERFEEFFDGILAELEGS